MQHCKSFFRSTSKPPHVYASCLTREVEERAIKSSRSLNTFWRSLIAAADADVLLPKRQIDEGPVSEISHWIYHEGAEVGLSTTPDYQKVEFTVTDLDFTPKTLWLCADLMSFMLPIQQVIFHALVLLFSLGFRQGMIIDMKYKAIIIAVIRDNEGRRGLVTTFTIWQNKLRAFQFTSTLLPYPLFCLTHLIGVTSIHFNAFKAGYTSIDDLLHRPDLEDDYIRLEWREYMLGRMIFRMSHTNFWRTLRHVLLVAGFSTLVRIYAFRLGTLAEYDGSLTQGVRNFVASHTQTSSRTSTRRSTSVRTFLTSALGLVLAEPQMSLCSRSCTTCPCRTTPVLLSRRQPARKVASKADVTS